jgi:hypothetical protein
VNVKLIPALAAGLLCAAPTFAAPITFDFEGVTSLASIGNYYNGGTDAAGNSGSNLGTSFGDDALGLTNDELGPYYSNAPTPGGVMAAVGPNASLNMEWGFVGETSFWYSAAEETAVSVWSGLNGTGELLGTLLLSANAQSNGCSDTAFCYWSLASLSFSGIAQSIQFGIESGSLAPGFDNVSVTAVPAPAAAWLMLSALGGLGVWTRRRRTVA